MCVQIDTLSEHWCRIWRTYPESQLWPLCILKKMCRASPSLVSTVWLTRLKEFTLAMKWKIPMYALFLLLWVYLQDKCCMLLISLDLSSPIYVPYLMHMQLTYSSLLWPRFYYYAHMHSPWRWFVCTFLQLTFVYKWQAVLSCSLNVSWLG